MLARHLFICGLGLVFALPEESWASGFGRSGSSKRSSSSNSSSRSYSAGPGSSGSSKSGAGRSSSASNRSSRSRSNSSSSKSRSYSPGSSAASKSGSFGRSKKSNSRSEAGSESYFGSESHSHSSRASSSNGSGFGRRDDSSPRARSKYEHRRRYRPYGPFHDYYLIANPYDRLIYDYYYRPRFFGFAPWGYYSYGYTPYWGRPEPAVEVYGRPRDPNPLSVSAFLSGMLPKGTYLGGADLRIEGKRIGTNMRLSVAGLPDPSRGGSDNMPIFSGHLTFSPLSTPHARLRIELGASGITAPDINYYGPDVGVSGQIALVGPLGFVFSGNYTPFPARMLDSQVMMSLQFGTFGVRAGYRHLQLDDTRINPWGGGVATFSGPSVSMGAVF